MMKRREFLALGSSALAAPALLPQTAYGQAKYPDRPIRMIVPFPPGGAYDTIARPWAERIRPLLGGQIVIENMGGAGGAVGAAAATRAAPDGYTILLAGATTHITEGLLKSRPMYDPMKDLTPVSAIAITAFAITAHPSVPVKDLKEFIAYVKANPGKVSYGSAGHGSLNHLTGELFKLRAGLGDLTHVPYRGAGPAITDLVGGQIPAIVPAMTNHVLALHRSGKARILAVTNDKRLEAAPDIPTAVEQGFPDLVTPNYIGIFTRSGTPAPMLAQLAAANLKLLADPDYIKLLISGTFIPQPGLGPDAYRKYVESEQARWAPVVKAMGIKLD
jgi:tripartite-type tricarboxylate transporter receptor subunit TctC